MVIIQYTTISLMKKIRIKNIQIYTSLNIQWSEFLVNTGFHDSL